MQFSRSSSEYKQIARDVVSLLRNEYLSDEGVFIMGKVGEERIKEYIVDDFGDVAPFIALYGGEDMCHTHISYIENHISKLGFERAFAYTDLILGLIWYSRNSGKYSDRSSQLADVLLKQVKERWYRDEVLYSVSKYSTTLPVTNGIDSTYVEVWTEAYRDSQDKEHEKMVIKTFRWFEYVRGKNTEGLIPAHHFSSYLKLPAKILFPVKANEIHVMKDNTNYLFGLLDMMRLGVLVDEASVAFAEVHEKLSFYAENNMLNNALKKTHQSDLLSSFAFIDVSCDAYKLTNQEKYLTPAITLAKLWINSHNAPTQLFPRYFSGIDTYFDCETDMAMALLKLYECTGDIQFLNKADDLVEGILKFHKNDYGFVTRVEVDSGNVVEFNYKTKFIALFIKILHVFAEGGRVYQDSKLFMLAKDR